MATALVHFAMRHRYNLHIKGEVSRALLANLEEYQKAWCKWMPKHYAEIAITADSEIDTSFPGESSIAGERKTLLAYSGGVDANFTLLRHFHDRAGRQRQNIKAAALVNGFDIPLKQQNLFAEALSLSREMLKPFGLPLAIIETNWKTTVCTFWEMEFSAAFAACFSQFAPDYPIALMAAGEDYALKAIPWGSNPITNPLLSARDWRFATDGNGFTRCEKAEFIVEYPEVKDKLRVCWMGPMNGLTGENCCRCEKCIRTKMNFLSVGSSPGKSLSKPHRAADVIFMNVRSRIKLSLLQEILDTARAHGVRGAWVRDLRLGVFLSRISIFANSFYSPVKKLFERIIRRIARLKS